ncbi:hypothetical protein FRB94_011709 [Tulasnella sp. JGI-2019a]|nr:hypothetical protein FRB94_011709 [Tulasnella sp. JGI-2019a]
MSQDASGATPRRRDFDTDQSGLNEERQPRRSSQHLDYLIENFSSNVPATPPYRRDPSTSQLDLGSRMPPDYRSEYAVSTKGHNEHDSEDEYPSEKGRGWAEVKGVNEYSHLRNDSEVQSEDEQAQFATASSTRKGVHYPDTDGGRLHNITPRAKRFSINNEGQHHKTHSRASSVVSSDVDDDDDEIYDWSDEEDLVDEEAKFEKKMGLDKPKKGWGLWRFITFFFSTLIGSTLLAGALVAGAILLRILWDNPHKSDHREYVTDNVEAWLFWAAANVLVSWWLASIIDVFPHFLTFLVDIVWGTVSEAWKSNLELYQTGKRWVKPLFYAGCSWVSWSILFEGIYDLYDGKDESQSRAPYTPRAYQVIRFLFFFTLVVCVEKLVIQMIAFSFHRTAFQERLDSVAEAVKVLDYLKDHRPKRRPGHASHGSKSAMGIFSPFAMISSATNTSNSRHGGTSHDDEVDPPSQTPHRGRTPEPRALEEGTADEGDVEDHDTDEDARNKPKKRKSWMGLSKMVSSPSNSKPPSRTVSRKNSSIMLQDSPTHRYPPAPSPPREGSPRSGAQTPVSGRQTPAQMNAHDGILDGKLLTNAGRALKTVVLHDARGITGEGHTDDDVVMFGLNSPHEAKNLARDLYHAFLGDPKRKYLIPSDFYSVYKTAEEAKEAFKVFDKDGNGDITRAEIKTAVLKVYKERRFLAKSLRDASQAVATLDGLMLILFLIILIFIALPIFGIEFTTKTFSSSIYTLFIGASFIFKNAAGSAFDSIMFLFVTHPFDTGDRCFIDQENLVVRKMGLFATTFIRSDGSLMYYFNSILLNKFINNARRSGNMAENLEMQVNWRTPQSKLDALEKRLNEWIDSDEKRWFKPGTSISFSKIEFQRSLYLTIGIGHNGTWQDWNLRLARKTAFNAAVQYFCRELNITCSASPQPVVFVDHDSAGPYHHEEEEEFNEPPTPRSGITPAGPAAVQLPEARHPMLGFLPPHGANHLRARRSNKKRLMGAAEGDF